MGMVWILLPASLFLAALFVGAFRWAVRSGQFDDPDREALRALFQESDPQATARCESAPVLDNHHTANHHTVTGGPAGRRRAPEENALHVHRS